MHALLARLASWFKSIGHAGNCYLCNKPMKRWSRGGYAYVESKGKKIYRSLLCREHYEGYFNFSAIKAAVHGKVLRQIRSEAKAKSRKNPK